MSIDLVMFDLGGVVCRFRPDVRASALAALCAVEEDEVRANLFGSGFDDECDRGEHDEAAVLARVRALGFRGGAAELRRAWTGAFEPDDAVLDLVARARPGRRTALLTDNGPVLLAALPVELPPVAAGFDHHLFSCLLGVTKPDPEAFRRALDRAGATAEQTFFTDDSERNVAAAATLGITAHHFTGAPGLRDALAAAGVL